MQLFSSEGGVCLALCPLKAKEKSRGMKGGQGFSTWKESEPTAQGFRRMGGLA